MSRLVSFLASLSIDYKVKTRLNMLSGDEHQHMINYSSKYIDDFFCYVLNSEKIITKPNQPNELTVSHLHSYIGWRGYLKGLGSMSAEERMAASEKGYKNGIGAMSAEEKMVARKKGDKMGIKWERKYAEFESYDGMPEIETPLYRWQNHELSKKPTSLNAKIRKENEEKEGSTVWSDRRVKLSECVEEKNRTKRGNAWERKYAEFESYDGMPEIGTLLHTWQKHQLGNGTGGLNAKIRKENEEKEGSTVWSDRRVKLFNCVKKKRRE
jgi:hypothetical protein